MLRPRHTAFRIAFALSRVKAGVPIGEVCDVVGISIATFRQWRRKYDGLRPAEVYRLRRLEDENPKIKTQPPEILWTRGGGGGFTIKGGRPEGGSIGGGGGPNCLISF